MSQYNYNPDVFRPADLRQAREIILTGESTNTEYRWEKETPVMTEIILRELELRHEQLVLDYGCGIGRLARELCTRGARVIGVDISPEMRRMASEYVNCPGRFLAVSPEEFDMLLAHGLRVDAAYAVWVLQHCIDPVQDLERIFNAVKLQGRFLVANNRFNRAIPVKETNAWIHDGIDIWKELDRYFGLQRTTPLPHDIGINPDIFLCRTYMKTFSRH